MESYPLQHMVLSFLANSIGVVTSIHIPQITNGVKCIFKFLLVTWASYSQMPVRVFCPFLCQIVLVLLMYRSFSYGLGKFQNVTTQLFTVFLLYIWLCTLLQLVTLFICILTLLKSFSKDLSSVFVSKGQLLALLIIFDPLLLMFTALICTLNYYFLLSLSSLYCSFIQLLMIDTQVINLKLSLFLMKLCQAIQFS